MHNRFPFHHRRKMIYFFWRNDQGKRIEESLRTDDLQVAEERYILRMAEIRGRRSPNDLARCNLTSASKYWLDHRRLRVAKGTLTAEASIVRNLARVYGGNTTVRSLADIRRIHLYQDARLKAGISAKSVNNEMQVFASILAMGGLWQRVEHLYKPLRVVKSDLPNALTREELTRVVQVAAESDPNAVAPFAAVLASSTGMRSGEIKGLRLGDLHHERTRPLSTSEGLRRKRIRVPDVLRLTAWRFGRHAN